MEVLDNVVSGLFTFSVTARRDLARINSQLEAKRESWHTDI